MIYDPFSPTRETNQDDIFRWYQAFALYLGHEPDSHHINQFRGHFPDDQLIEVWIAIFGSSRVQWDYGHWKRTQGDLVNIYGTALIPHLEKRIAKPLHGGGTAYGEAYLTRSKDLVQVFCQNTLDVLRRMDGCS